jgi:hypothetical protein
MRKSILAAGVAALAVLTAGAALAQSAPQAGQHRAARGDADGDGRISRAEFVDARVARLTAIDANRDGSISAEERQSGIDTRRNQRASHRFEMLDKNGDGSISREEFTAQREPRGERMGRGERAGRHERRGQRAGFRGGRGHGEWGPRAEARSPLTIADVQTRLTTQFDRIDTNRDGFITAEERTAARQSMRAERQERRAARQAARQASPSAPASE